MSTTNKMKYRLSADNRYIKDNPIIVNFELENISNENFWILTWYTPLEGLRGKIFRVMCDGKEIPYEGPMIKRGEPQKDDYIQLLPRKPVSVRVDLSSAYTLPTCNQTLVEFKGRIYDHTTSANLTSRTAEKHQMIDITGNTVTFSVVNP